MKHADFTAFKDRVVSLTEKTVCHLKRYLTLFHSNGKPDIPLFYSVIKGNQSAMSTGNVERLINKYADLIRLEHPNLPDKIYLHMFRMTWATNLYQNGVELELVSGILGHASTQTTRIYASPSLEMMRKAMGSSMNGIPEESPMWLDDEDELAHLCGLR